MAAPTGDMKDCPAGSPHRSLGRRLSCFSRCKSRDHKLCSGGARNPGGQSSDGVLTGQARCRVVAAKARGGRLHLPGKTVVAQTVADDLSDLVLFDDRLRKYRAALTPRNSRMIWVQVKKGQFIVRGNHRR